jgi:hypothetical protein
MTDTQATSKELTFVECDSCRRKPGSPALCAGCLHNRTVISKLKRREGRIVDWFNVVEPVAWCDPADIAEHRISFCGVSGRMIDSNERFTMPLYAAPSASATQPTHEPECSCAAEGAPAGSHALTCRFVVLTASAQPPGAAQPPPLHEGTLQTQGRCNNGECWCHAQPARVCDCAASRVLHEKTCASLTKGEGQ